MRRGERHRHLATGVIGRLRTTGAAETAGFALRRFFVVRRLARTVAACTRAGASAAPVAAAGQRGLFADVHPQAVLGDLKRRSWCPWPGLPPDLLASLLAELGPARLYCPSRPEVEFVLANGSAAGREAAQRALGMPIAIAHYRLSDSARDMVHAIARDPALLDSARRFLGHTPRLRVFLYRSFVVDLDRQRRMRQFQTPYFHYDLGAFREFICNFYLTDTDARSGAHVLVENSHGPKRLRHLFGPTYLKDDDVHRCYPGKVVTVTGARGYGFVQDPFCLHKALLPLDHDRILLQIKYC